MVMVDRFVLGVSLVALDLFCLFSGGLQVRLSRAFRVDREQGPLPFEVVPLTGGTGPGVCAKHQTLEQVSTIETLVFVDRHGYGSLS